MNYSSKHLKMKYDLDKFEQSAVIGYWRMGVDSATSEAIMDSTTFAIDRTIYDYKRKLNIDLKRQKTGSNQ